jgi:hypothetical protein
MINKTVDITVTSVHQTTAGKMIFGRLDEKAEAQANRAPHAQAITDIPRQVEHAGRAEAVAGGEHGPRSVVPDPSHGPE